MIENWIEIHLVSDKFYNIANLCNSNSLQGMTNNVRFKFSGGDTTRGNLQRILSKTNIFGDVIFSSHPLWLWLIH